MKSLSLKSMLRQARESKSAQQFLTPKQQETLLKLTTVRCRQGTKQSIADNIERPLTEWPGRWAIERIYFEGDDGQEASYCAGQDYTTEMADLRKQLVQFR